MGPYHLVPVFLSCYLMLAFAFVHIFAANEPEVDQNYWGSKLRKFPRPCKPIRHLIVPVRAHTSLVSWVRARLASWIHAPIRT